MQLTIQRFIEISNGGIVPRLLGNAIHAVIGDALLDPEKHLTVSECDAIRQHLCAAVDRGEPDASEIEFVRTFSTDADEEEAAMRARWTADARASERIADSLFRNNGGLT